MKRIKDLFAKIWALPRNYKIIGVILILVVLFLVFRGRGKTTPLQFASVTRNNIQSEVSASGILSGKNVSTLHFNQAGKLNYLGVANGDIVRQGETIATLDGTAFNSALQQALNNRRNTQANVDYIHDQVKGNEGDETFAQKATRTAAEVANDNAYDTVLAAQKTLKDTVIYSPLSGVVVAQDNISAGQNVTPNDLVAQVVDFSQKRFEATVDESDIGNIKVGQDAIVTLNAYGDTQFKGRVVEINSETKTDSSGSITVTVRIQVDDARIQTIYGLNGQANVITHAKQNVLTLPQDALIDDTHVYVKLPNGKTEKRTIETGIKSDTDAEVVSGLTEGEQVVTNPQAVTTK